MRKVVRPAPLDSRQSESAAQTVKIEPVVFTPDSDEFAQALRKISPETLRLLKEQFKLEPASLVCGLFMESSETITLENADDSFETDAEFSDDISED